MAGEDGLVRQILGDHRFSYAVGTKEDDVASLANEIQCEGAFDQFPIDFLGPIPIEINKRLEAFKTCAFQPAGKTSLGAILKLDPSQFFEHYARRPAVFGCPRDEVV